MLNSFESAWRYPVALVGGLLVGIYVGGMLATIYVILAFRQSLDSLDPLKPWFIRYSWTDLAARPAVLEGALIITGSVALALTIVGLAGVYRGRLNQYDDAHFQSKREMRRRRVLGVPSFASPSSFATPDTTCGPTKPSSKGWSASAPRL